MDTQKKLHIYVKKLLIFWHNYVIILEKGGFMVEREIFKEVVSWLNTDKVIVIKGARQVGKTTLLLWLKEFMESRDRKVVYIAADEYRDRELFEDANLFLKFLEYEYGLKKNMDILIDEFQYIKQAGLFIKNLIDIVKRERLKINIIVTGSSSLEISRNTEFLTGRKVEFLLFPFSFYEYLSLDRRFSVKFNIDTEFKDAVDFYRIYKDKLKQRFVSYIQWGGYPEVAIEKENERRKVLLKEIISTYIEKDIAGFLRVENVSAFNKLARILSAQIGSLVNKNELSNTLNLHHKTLTKYLNILEGTFVFSFVSPFYRNIRKELSKMPKVYINDPGIYYYFHPEDLLSFDSIRGNVVENYIYNSLKGIRGLSSVNFYRTIAKSEVDFILQKEGEIIPMEVKFRSKVKVPVSIKHFQERYKVNRGIIITKDEIKKEGDIYFIPASIFGLMNI